MDGYIKDFIKIIPNCGLRYDLIKLKGSILDFIYAKITDGLIVQSISLKEFYNKHYHVKKEKIFINYNPITKRNQSYKNKNNKITIGYVGNVEMHKGSQDIYNILCNLPDSYTLKIAGGSKGKDNIKLLNKMKNINVCQYLGKLNKEDCINFTMK